MRGIGADRSMPEGVAMWTLLVVIERGLIAQ